MSEITTSNAAAGSAARYASASSWRTSSRRSLVASPQRNGMSSRVTLVTSGSMSQTTTRATSGNRSASRATWPSPPPVTSTRTGPRRASSGGHVTARAYTPSSLSAACGSPSMTSIRPKSWVSSTWMRWYGETPSNNVARTRWRILRFASQPSQYQVPSSIASALAEHDHHEERVARAVEQQVRFEAVEPFDELEAARELDERAELLGKDHPRQMGLPVDASGAVLNRFERHVLPEDLADGVHLVERRKRRTHDEASAAS